ncbi:hypothetical protein GIB67_018591 [Kingdonia uniflora]|uniref:Uncharacterized protein n=1 Tax=Kingdonia uniflora TaxID=39325 RepID=A0A7J7L8H9_9MAGN|nr:hypothetical protein GIB67_018591 [Kingdonia uniflora]
MFSSSYVLLIERTNSFEPGYSRDLGRLEAMFTEGLDSNAVRWVREGSGTKNRETPFLISNQMGHRAEFRSGGTGFGLPPPSKFRSGHLLSGVVELSRAIPVNGVDSDLDSDMDETSDSDGNIYIGHGRGRYSLDSSPDDDVRCQKPSVLGSRQPHYASDNVSDFSSSRGTVGQRKGCGLERSGQHDYTEESLASSMSFGYASTHVGNNNISGPHGGAYVSEVSSVPSAKKNIHVRGPQNKKLFGEDVPSAPPFCASNHEIKNTQDAEQNHSPTSYITPHTANSNCPFIIKEANSSKLTVAGVHVHNKNGNTLGNRSVRTSAGVEAAVSSGSLPARLPTYHASVQQVLLQSEQELLAKRSSEIVSEGAAPKPKKIIGKIKVQVRRVKLGLDPPTGCSFASLKPPMESLRYRFLNLQSTLSAGWEALRKIHVVPRVPVNGSFSQHSLAYMQASTQYIKQVSSLLKIGVTTLRNSSSSYEVVQETFSCLLRMKSSSESEAVRMQPGSGEAHIFFPDSLGDDLTIEVQDSKGKSYGRVNTQVATIAEDSGDKVRWLYIYYEPEHELVGRIQLYINYSTSQDENAHLKCGPVAETVAYDLLLEVAMKVQQFQQRKLILDGPWKWLLTEFASYYGVSNAYTNLRYLSYVMDVATPTADCLQLVYDLLLPVIKKGHPKSSLSHQEVSTF